MLEWLAEKGYRLKAAPAFTLRHLFEHQERFQTMEELADDARIAPSVFRFQMRKKGLPAPSLWVQAARGLTLARAVHDNPHASLGALGRRLGYADHVGMLRSIERPFDVRHPRVRAEYDPMDLMDRWWKKARRPSRVAA